MTVIKKETKLIVFFLIKPIKTVSNYNNRNVILLAQQYKLTRLEMFNDIKKAQQLQLLAVVDWIIITRVMCACMCITLLEVELIFFQNFNIPLEDGAKWQRRHYLMCFLSLLSPFMSHTPNYSFPSNEYASQLEPTL